MDAMLFVLEVSFAVAADVSIDFAVAADADALTHSLTCSLTDRPVFFC